MKQLEHANILPFYGVSTTVADLCLVFPWYGNGDIMEYVKRKPNISRYVLVSTLERASGSRHLLASTNSYVARPADCTFCTKICWFMER